jgi:hypothetical protein
MVYCPAADTHLHTQNAKKYKNRDTGEICKKAIKKYSLLLSFFSLPIWRR